MFTLRAPQKEFELGDVAQWLSRTEDHHNIQAIDLPGKKINDDIAMLINSLAMHCKRLRCLKLDKNLISDTGAKSLAEAIPHFKNGLVQLDLSSNRLGAQGAEEVAKVYLSDLPGLSDSGVCGSTVEASAGGGRGRVLDLSHNDLGDRGVALVAKHLSGRGAVRLRVRGVGCGQAGLSALLPRKEALGELDIGLNPVGVVAVTSLSHAVCGASHWHTLNLSHLTALRDSNARDGRSGNVVTPLVGCLKGAGQLRDLDCSGNNIGDHGGRMLVEAMQESQHTLERLALGESSCGIQTSNALQTALKKIVPKGSSGYPGLRVLELPNNRLTDECAAILAEGVAKCLSLMRLFLSRNSINDRGAADLARGLERQRSNKALPSGYDQPGCIVELDLAGNPVGDEGAKELATAAMASVHEGESTSFKVPWGLEKLFLSDTAIGVVGKDALASAVATRAVLADMAASGLAKSPDDTLLRTLRSKRVRMPAGLEVLGLDLDDRAARPMRNHAHSMLSQLWPTPAIPADEAAGTSRPGTPRRFDDTDARRSEPPVSRRCLEPLPHAQTCSALDEQDASGGPWPIVGGLSSLKPLVKNTFSAAAGFAQERFGSGTTSDANTGLRSRAASDTLAGQEQPQAGVDSARARGGLTRGGGTIAWMLAVAKDPFSESKPDGKGGVGGQQRSEPRRPGGCVHGPESLLGGGSMQPFQNSTADHPRSGKTTLMLHEGPADLVHGGPADLGAGPGPRGLKELPAAAKGPSTQAPVTRPRHVAAGVEACSAPDGGVVSSDISTVRSSGGSLRTLPVSSVSVGTSPMMASSRDPEGHTTAVSDHHNSCRADLFGSKPDTHTAEGVPLAEQPAYSKDVNTELRRAGSVSEGVRRAPTTGSLERDPATLRTNTSQSGTDRCVDAGNGGGEEATAGALRHSARAATWAPRKGELPVEKVERLITDLCSGGGGKEALTCGTLPKRDECKGGTCEEKLQTAATPTGKDEDKKVGAQEAANPPPPCSKEVEKGGGAITEAVKQETGVAGKGKGKGAPPTAPPGKGGKGGAPPGKGSPPPGKAAPTPPQGGQPPPPSGKGKGPPPPGKGTAPPAKGKGKGAPGKGDAKPKATLKAQQSVPRNFGETPFGRRIHWVQPSYEEPDGESIFGELGTGHDLFDSELLKAMLSASEQEKRASGPRRNAITRRPTGIIVLNATRAQNMAIVLSKLKVSSEELCSCLHELNFGDPRLSIDDVELLIMVMPTPEESKKLLEYKDVVDQLRDVEQKVMPFCTLPRSIPRLKLMKFALSHASTYTGLLERCNVLRLAAEEARGSTQLRELLSVILRVGNFINHGIEEAREGTVRGFAIESLMTLASFKTGAVSTLHFLCLTMRSSDLAFLQDLRESLQHVHDASREKSGLLKTAIEAFQREFEFVQRETEQLEGESAGKDRMVALVAALGKQSSTLKEELDGALQTCIDVQKYFSNSEKALANLPPCEQFFGHIANFIDSLTASWTEIEKNPTRWKQFASTPKSSQKAQRKSVPPMRMSAEAEEDGESIASGTGAEAASEAMPKPDPSTDGKPPRARGAVQAKATVRRRASFAAVTSEVIEIREQEEELVSTTSPADGPEMKAADEPERSSSVEAVLPDEKEPRAVANGSALEHSSEASAPTPPHCCEDSSNQSTSSASKPPPLALDDLSDESPAKHVDEPPTLDAGLPIGATALADADAASGTLSPMPASHSTPTGASGVSPGSEAHTAPASRSDGRCPSSRHQSKRSSSKGPEPGEEVAEPRSPPKDHPGAGPDRRSPSKPAVNWAEAVVGYQPAAERAAAAVAARKEQAAKQALAAAAEHGSCEATAAETAEASMFGAAEHSGTQVAPEITEDGMAKDSATEAPAEVAVVAAATAEVALDAEAAEAPPAAAASPKLAAAEVGEVTVSEGPATLAETTQPEEAASDGAAASNADMPEAGESGVAKEDADAEAAKADAVGAVIVVAAETIPAPAAAAAVVATGAAGVDEAAVDEAAIDKALVDEAPVDKAAVDEVAVDKASVDEAPVVKASVDEVAVDKAAVGEAPVDDAAVDEAAVDGDAVEEAAVGEAEAAVGEAAVDKAAVDKAAVDEAAVDNAAFDEAQAAVKEPAAATIAPGLPAAAVTPARVNISTSFSMDDDAAAFSTAFDEAQAAAKEPAAATTAPRLPAAAVTPARVDTGTSFSMDDEEPAAATTALRLPAAAVTPARVNTSTSFSMDDEEPAAATTALRLPAAAVTPARVNTSTNFSMDDDTESESPRSTTIEEEYEFDTSRVMARPTQMSMEAGSSTSSTPRSTTIELEYELAFSSPLIDTRSQQPVQLALLPTNATGIDLFGPSFLSPDCAQRRLDLSGVDIAETGVCRLSPHDDDDVGLSGDDDGRLEGERLEDQPAIVWAAVKRATTLAHPTSARQLDTGASGADSTGAPDGDAARAARETRLAAVKAGTGTTEDTSLLSTGLANASITGAAREGAAHEDVWLVTASMGTDQVEEAAAGPVRSQTTSWDSSSPEGGTPEEGCDVVAASSVTLSSEVVSNVMEGARRFSTDSTDAEVRPRAVDDARECVAEGAPLFSSLGDPQAQIALPPPAQDAYTETVDDSCRASVLVETTEGGTATPGGPETEVEDTSNVSGADDGAVVDDGVVVKTSPPSALPTATATAAPKELLECTPPLPASVSAVAAEQPRAGVCGVVALGTGEVVGDRAPLLHSTSGHAEHGLLARQSTETASVETLSEPDLGSTHTPCSGSLVQGVDDSMLGFLSATTSHNGAATAATAAARRAGSGPSLFFLSDDSPPPSPVCLFSSPQPLLSRASGLLRDGRRRQFGEEAGLDTCHSTTQQPFACGGGDAHLTMDDDVGLGGTAMTSPTPTPSPHADEARLSSVQMSIGNSRGSTVEGFAAQSLGVAGFFEFGPATPPATQKSSTDLLVAGTVRFAHAKARLTDTLDPTDPLAPMQPFGCQDHFSRPQSLSPRSEGDHNNNHNSTTPDCTRTVHGGGLRPYRDLEAQG